MLRIGVDCGGTNTDAVCCAPDSRVLGWCKRPTSADVLEGVVAAVTGALRDAGRGPEEVGAVMLGTTQFVNAYLQLQGLARVAVVRLCGPATHSLPPFCDMPPALRDAVGGCYFLAAGGYEFDGRTEIAPVDEAQLRRIARQIVAAGIHCVVVSGVFSPVLAAQEQRAAAVLQEEAAAVAAERAEREAAAGSQCRQGSRTTTAPQRTPAQQAQPGAMDPALLSQQLQQQGQQELLGEPALLICQSHELGQLGLLERENAAVLNAALLPLACCVVPACVAALAAAGVTAPLFFTGNDGTLLSAADALKMPVATFQSGPVNSLRGAALLTGLQHAAVVDIGGTTADVGMLVNGLPRPAPRSVRFADVATNFQMPDVFSIGLGGGSLVHFLPAALHVSVSPAAEASSATSCTVGPDSVGARLPQEALCMGGPSCTASDVAVRLGKMELGSPQAAAAGLTEAQAQAAWATMQRMLEGCLDDVKTQAGDVPVVVVGGGAPLCGGCLQGASQVVRPQHAAVANAAGAAIACVSGTVDAVFDMGPTLASRAAVLAQAEQLATERAVRAGARQDSCWVACREEVPLAYLPGSTSRVTVKVVGDIDLASLTAAPAPPAFPDLVSDSKHQASAAAAAAGSRQQAHSSSGGGGQEDEAAAVLAPALTIEETKTAAVALGTETASGWPPLPGRSQEPSPAALAAWEPVVSPAGDWLLHEPDLHLIAVGAGILGCGGGGSFHKALLKAGMELQRACVGSMRVITPAAVPDTALVVDAGFMGAPTVGIEKLDSDQAEAAAQAVVAAYQASSAMSAAMLETGGGESGTPGTTGSGRLAAVMAGEVGGGNGIEPLVVGSRLGLPVVDGDLMGRAFPELQMMTSAIYGLPVVPAAVADEKGNAVVVQRAASAAWLERLLRPVCTEMGCSAGFSSCPITGEQLRLVVVPHSLSVAWHLGKAVAHAQHAKQDAPSAIAEAGGGRVLFTGKVVDVQRRTTGGFARGELLLEGSSAWAGRSMRILFQNENLVAQEEGSQQPEACVPDLICCVEEENGLPIATEEMRYGLRAAVVGLPAHPLLTTPQALAVVGPAAFGYSGMKYVPLAQYAEPVGIPRTA